MTIITRLKQGVLDKVPLSLPPSLWNSITSANTNTLNSMGAGGPLARASTFSATSPLPPSNILGVRV